MKKIILLFTFFVNVIVVNAATSITYMVQFRHLPAGSTDTVASLPSGLTENDIVWTCVLLKNGCTKTNGDQKITWRMSSGTFTGNLSMFNSCVQEAKAGDVVRMTMTINHPGHPYHGAKGTCETTVKNGATLAMLHNGILFEEPVIPPKISVTGVAFCAGATGQTVKARITDAPADMTGYTIDWGIAGITTSGAISATAGATGSINPAQVTTTKTGQAKLKKADGTVVATSANYTVTVNPKPTLTFSPATPSVCSGSGTQITASLNPAGNTYVWKKDGAQVGTSNKLSTGNLTSNATYEVTGTSSAGCASDPKTVTVTVKPLPTLTSLTASKNDVCAKEAVTLTANASGATSYTWTNATGNAATASVSPSATTTYGVIAVKDGCNSSKKEVTVTVHTVSVNIAANPPTASYGGSVQLTATPTFNPAGNTANNYSWKGDINGSTSGATLNRVTTNNMTQGSNFEVEVTDNMGCKGSKAITVSVTGDALAVTPPANSPNGYVNTPINTGVTASGGDGNYTYTWTSNDPTVTIQDKGNGNVSITSSTTGTKEVCVEVSSAGDNVTKCFSVIVTDPSVVSLVMSVDKKCAYAGEFLTIEIRGNGANTYSFVLRDQSNSAVMTVTDKASWDTYKVYTNAAGTYKITDFKYKIAGIESTGDIPAPVTAMFDPVPDVKANADGLANIDHCEGDQLILKGSSDEKGLQYTWDNGVTDGVPFEPTMSTTYTVTGTDPVTQCAGTSTVDVTIRPRPTVQAPPMQEVCAGELVTLTATGSADVVDIKWSNNVDNDVPFKPTLTATYEVTVTNDGGCTATDSVKVVVNPAPEIWRSSKNPRNIAIGKDAYFAVSVEGENLTYQWKKKENDVWVDLDDVTNSVPIIIGSHTDSISFLTVPQSWDGSEFRVVVSSDCGADSMDFQLSVKECFEITAELVMDAGIIPDEDPGNLIDGWFCRGQKISLKAVITSEEGYDIENPHYKWTIDGLDLPEEHVELVSDTAILTWIPQFTEDDIVVKVAAYCDGACEEVYPQRLRLKAREFEDVALKIMTDEDPEDRFCAGDTVNFWLSTRNAGKSPQYAWYNDVFELPEEESPKNEVVYYDSAKVTLVMGQEDTWMRVVMTPSPEICVKEPVIIDTLFMKKKPWMEPVLHIDCSDTLVCRGDSVSMLAVQSNAGANPTFQWQRSIGAPFPDWNLGTDYFATVFVDEEDVWVKCTMTPSNDICWDQTKPIVDAIKINVFRDSSEVRISCDMEDKEFGDELVFEAETKNLLGEPRYEWYVDEMKAPCTESEYIASSVAQGAVVYCLVSGEKICQTRIKSNEIIVDYGNVNRDTMIVIYKNERVKDLNMVKEGDDLATVLFKIDETAKFGVGSITTDGKFNYTPMAGFVGTDEVKYVIVNRKDKSIVAEGYIYITVQENDRFFVPNLITPNGDGINDTWELDFLSEYPNHLIQVFDRTGRIVFEARNYQNDWDGKGMTKSGYVGQINLVNGVYTYIIDLGDKNKTILKSWIEIRANLNRRNYR